ncbi:MAG: cytochrome C [Anaerolineae bacterium]|nr:cytochrome C [Anaerolineae bacterium]
MTTNVIPSTPTQSALSSPQTGLRRWLKWLPSLFFIVAAVLLLVSISQPYWGLVLQAPQYPGGLRLRVFVNNMTGDEDPKLDEVREIDGLNHYIGMKSLYEAAKFERSIAIPAVILMVALLVVAAFWRRRWTWLLAIPALLFPIIFLADLGFWMAYYGQNLDPYAPLSSSIQPFTPPVLGEGVIGQFKTVAYVDTGWYIVFVGSLLIAAALLVKLGSRNMKPEG